MSEKFKSALGFRWIAFEEDTCRLELQGVFTAEDLRNLADWLDDPDHPVVAAGIPVMKVKLSRL